MRRFRAILRDVHKPEGRMPEAAALDGLAMIIAVDM